MRRSTRGILEEIDDAEMQVERLRANGHGMIETAKSEGRALSPSEDKKFDQLCDTSTETRQNINQLRAELQQTQEHQRQLITMSRNPSANIYQNTYSGDCVLPVNGVLPGDQQRRYRKHYSLGTLRAFNNEQSAFDSGMWLRAVVSRVNGHIDSRAEDYCKNVGLEIVNAGSESTGATGGYLTPAPVASAIINIRERVGVTRKALRITPTAGDTLTVPKKTGGLTVYAPGENTAITASDTSWGAVSCILKKRGVLTLLSSELNDDALINIVDLTFEEMAYALAGQEDNELVNGTGAATTYFGVRGLLSSLGAGGVSTAATGNDTWPELTLADLMAAVGKLPDRYHEYNPKWICSHSFYNGVMVRLALAAGGATLAEVMGGVGNTRMFAGYEVLLTSKMPTATGVAQVSALFGAFDQACVMADKGSISVARSDDYKFAEDQIALRATSRYDIQVHDAGTASAAGAYVGLSTAS